MKAVPVNRYLVFFGLATAGCLLDLTTKSWFFNRLGMPPAPIEWLWPGYVGFETSLNQGALFGIGQGMVFLFAGLSVLAAMGIVYWLFVAKAAGSWLLTVALGSICGGIFGNLYDRLGLHGLVCATGPIYAVRDWMLLQVNDNWRWPNFNIADALLVCGAALLIWHAWQEPSSEPATRLEGET